MAPPPQVPIDMVMAMAEANEDPAALIGPRDATVPTLEGLNLVGFDNRIDSERIRSELGWQPRVDYHAAMSAMRMA